MSETETDRRIDAIETELARLAQLVPANTGAWGDTWQEDALAAFERAHACQLPHGYRRFLLRIGDGGPAPGLGLRPLRDREQQELSRLSRPFPLDRAWATPDAREEVEDAGLLEDYEKLLYPLPEGASVDDGTLVLGATPDHRGMLLVVTGADPGQVWLDNRGNDFEEVVPSGSDFLQLVEQWLDAALEEAEAQARFDALVAAGDLDALRDSVGEDELQARFAAVLKANRAPEPPAPVPPALARMMATHFTDKYGTAGQALALGGCWAELEARCREDWAAFEAGTLEPSFRAEATVQAHLAVATAALGRPSPIHAYAATGGGYWHRSSDLVPLIVSRWTDGAAVAAVFERLRADVGLDFLACFPAPALHSHLALATSLGEGWLDQLASDAYPQHAKSTMGGRTSKVLDRLLSLAGDDAAAASDGLKNALGVWLWLTGCTGSTKSYEKAVARASQIGFPAAHATREAAKDALAQRVV